MIFTTPMRLLVAVVLDEASEEVSKELLRQGTLDMVSVQELSGEWKTRVEPMPHNITLARIGELRKRIEGFFQAVVPPLEVPEPTLENLTTLDLDVVDRTLNEFAADVNSLREKRRKIQDELIKLKEIRRQVVLMDNFNGHARRKSSYSFLSIHTGTLSPDGLSVLQQSLESLPSILIPSGLPGLPSSSVLLITLKRDEFRVTPLLSEAGWEDVSLPEDTIGTKEAVVIELDSKIEALESRQGESDSELSALFESKAENLSRIWSSLRVDELLIRMRSRFSRTQRTVLFSGWIPRELQKEVEAGLNTASKGYYYLEWISPNEGDAYKLDVPVSLKTPKLLQPFEMLVKNYGIPEYGAINPTPFVAVAYLLMFGLMFGDAGHGLVLVILGILGTLTARKKEKPDGLFRLITYCGFSAVAAGVLFGSYFGHGWLPPLWFDYHGAVSGHAEHAAGIRSVYDILGITIKFGMAVLGTGFVINWINLLRKKKWTVLALDKGGLLGGWIYATGAWAAFYFVEHDYKGLPPSSLLFWLLGIPTLIIALKAPIGYFLKPKEKRKPFNGFTVVDFFMEWIVEVLEIYSGYLANTLSFMRVAGLGIAHVSLMTAFFQIARMVNPGGGLSAASLAVLIFGNALVIALEGLSAGIQSLRLNYYEFFSKYFNGTGRAYNPVSLHGKE